MSKLLTVVIAAYNMHDYLRRCLDSICVESVMGDVQVIVVNDGSTDDTSQIAHEYADRYPHYFLVIDKENGNYGSCMNVALPLAEGKYFRTLDADDWYDTEAYQTFVQKLKGIDADMVITEKVDCFSKQKRQSPVIFDKDLPLHQTVSIDAVDWHNPSLGAMMGVMFLSYRTVLLRNSGIHWVERVPFTDFQTIIQPLRLVQTVHMLPLPLYQYQLEREGQSVSLPVSHYLNDVFVKVSSAIVSDVIRWDIQKYSDNKRLLIEKKLSLLLHNVYRSLYIMGPEAYKSIGTLETIISHDHFLRTLTSRYNELWGIHYVRIYRFCPLLMTQLHQLYRLRVCVGSRQ